MNVGNEFSVGRVSAVDASRLRIRAVFPDRDHVVSGWLPLVMPPQREEARGQFLMPEVGQMVLCVFLGNGRESGFWLGVIA